jgi:hypothetical protein
MYYDFDVYLKSRNYTMETKVNDTNRMLIFELIRKRGNIQWLITTYKPNINLSDTEGRTLLFYTVFENDIVMLINNGLNINATDVIGRSAVYYQRGSRVCMLLELGASFKDALDGILFELEKKEIIQSYIDSSTRCKNTLVVFLKINKQHNFIHKDLVKVIAKMVWKTRRQKRVWCVSEN